MTTFLAYGILIGGKGSPPHVDSMTNIMSRFIDDTGNDNYLVDLEVAIGYLIQGKKYIWALPPKGGKSKLYLEFYRDKPSQLDTVAEQLWRGDIYSDGVPHPFQGEYSMGWPTEAEWDAMKGAGIHNHFHPLLAGDRYIVMDGSFHAVCNDPDLQPVSVAADDAWVTGYSDLCYLRHKLASTCKT